MMDDLKSLYLNLMKSCLVNLIYPEAWVEEAKPGGFLKSLLVRIINSKGFKLVKLKPVDLFQRLEGKDWPVFADTMIGFKRLDNIRFCIEDVLKNDIQGDLIETGVWRGGAVIFMRAVLKAYNVKDRLVWVADSFEGLPPPDQERFPKDSGDLHHTFKSLVASLDQVKSNFQKYGLLDDQVRFLKGWFKDTLPEAPIHRLSIMRLDGDMYESTMEALIYLYPKLSKGGYVIVDDYGALPPCRKAVLDFRSINNIRDEIHQIDWTGIYWRRTT